MNVPSPTICQIHGPQFPCEHRDRHGYGGRRVVALALQQGEGRWGGEEQWRQNRQTSLVTKRESQLGVLEISETECGDIYALQFRNPMVFSEKS
jgi:hypothetical protein